MRFHVQIAVWLIALFCGLAPVSRVAAQGSAFTYQGQLNAADGPANGSYDVVFALYTESVNGTLLAGPVTNLAILVTNGLFTTTVDLGPGVFVGGTNWLELAVSTNQAGDFATLAPRQWVTPVPYALYTANAGLAGRANTVAATGISGVIPLAQLPAGIVTNHALGISLSGNLLGNASTANLAVLASNVVSGISITNAFLTNGVFAGNGAGLTNLNAANLASGTLALSQLPTAVVTNGATGLSLTGVFRGNGAALTNVNLATVNGNGALAWLTNAGATNILFQMATNANLAVGAFPQGLAAVDINHDGWVDLISANAGAGTLTILTNNGAGKFGFNATLAVGSVPLAMLAVDVNGDGAPDLVSANNYANTLTVLTNNGGGVFGSNATYLVGSGPQGLVAAHVGGTTNWDLVVANGGGSTLTILTNNSRGVFALATNLPVGGRPVAVAAADFNGDGAMDLVSANSTDGTLTVWFNNGSGQFVASTTLTVGNDPQAVLAVEINGDGQPDLLCANFNDSTLTVFLNQGGGAFAPGLVYPVGANPVALVAADVNADQNVDLICANQGANTLTVLTNNGSGFFNLAITLGTGPSPDALVAADVNGDRLIDLVDANQAGGGLTLFTNASVVTAVPASPIPVPTFSGSFVGSGTALTNITPASISGGVTINLPVVLANGHTNVLVIVNGIITKIQ